MNRLAGDELVVRNQVPNLPLVYRMHVILVLVVEVALAAFALVGMIVAVVLVVVLLKANVVILVDFDDLRQQVSSFLDSILVQLRLYFRGVTILFHKRGELQDSPERSLRGDVLGAQSLLLCRSLCLISLFTVIQKPEIGMSSVGIVIVLLRYWHCQRGSHIVYN